MRISRSEWFKLPGNALDQVETWVDEMREANLPPTTIYSHPEGPLGGLRTATAHGVPVAPLAAHEPHGLVLITYGLPGGEVYVRRFWLESYAEPEPSPAWGKIQDWLGGHDERRVWLDRKARTIGYHRAVLHHESGDTYTGVDSSLNGALEVALSRARVAAERYAALRQGQER